jgi:hypothetical protein
VGPRAGLDWCGNSGPPPAFDPRTVQPVASHYTDRAIPAHDNVHTKDELLQHLNQVVVVAAEQCFTKECSFSQSSGFTSSFPLNASHDK